MSYLLGLLQASLLVSSSSSWKHDCKEPDDYDTPIRIGVFVPQNVYDNGTLGRQSSTDGDMTDDTGIQNELGDFNPGIKLALRHIRQAYRLSIADICFRHESCLLSGYQLALTYKSTQCTSARGMKALFDVINLPEGRPVAVFGAKCTEVNEPIAMALKYWQMIQISYAENHPKFSSADSQELYPSFFRVVPAFRNTNEAKLKFIKTFNWTRVGTIRQTDDPRYSLAHEKLTTSLGMHRVEVAYTAGISHHEFENIRSQLREIKKRDIRIIVMDAAVDMAAIVACEAYEEEMYGPGYVWILPGYHNDTWGYYNATRMPSCDKDTCEKDDADGKAMRDNCTREAIEAVLDGHFSFQFARQRKDLQAIMPTGKTAAKVLEEMKKLSKGAKLSMWSAFLYDGLWTLAYALAHEYNIDGTVNYTRMLATMSETSFQGLTGTIKFESNERLGIVDIRQYKNGKYVEVGHYDGADTSFNLSTKGWDAPPDRMTVIQEREYISISILVAFSLLALIGVLCAVFFLVVNVRYRNHRFIKMSSPNLNNIIIIGSMFTYASIILLGVDTRIIPEEHFVKLCYARTWILCLGFTLAFGSMFSKTWRVHSIFTNIRMDKKAIKDSKLLLMLGVLIAIDIIVLSFWAIFSPFTLYNKRLDDITHNNTRIERELETCASERAVIFQAILYVVKGILMILGCFLAWETRHVNVPALNDSKYIGMSVYNVVVMSVLGLSIAFILQDRVNEAYALGSLFIAFATTLTLCLLFVPKLIELMRNPQGTEPKGYRRGMMKSMVTKAKTPVSPHSTLVSHRDSEKDLLGRAEAENALKHRVLQEKSAQLWDLLERLRDLGDTTFMQQDWCFAMASLNCTTTAESDALLGSEHRSESTSGGGGGSNLPVAPQGKKNNGRNHEKDPASTRSKDGYPWIDPDEPSTML